MALSKRTVLALFIASSMAALFLLAIFPAEPPRTFMNHLRAVASMRSLNLAEHNYAAQHPEAGFACNLGDLGEQGSSAASRIASVDGVLASGTKSHYHFEIACAQSESQKTTVYTMTAVSTKPGTTGVYALCTDQDGEIWYSENGSTTDCLARHRPIEPKYR
jgi:hypothetical protein